MELVDVTQKTEETFFRCLHDEIPVIEEVIALRRRWYDQHRMLGLKAKVLLREDGAVVGLCQYIPIEHSHLIGEDLIAILCIWVHGFDHLVGNQQGKGYGRFILNSIEEDARTLGAKGVAAWGMNFPYWNPVSFYERMGYERADICDPVVLVWKSFTSDAKAPSLMRPNRTPDKKPDKTTVTVFFNSWCPGGCEPCVTAREAVAGLENIAVYSEVDTSDRAAMLSWGIENAVYLDDTPFRPFAPPWSSEELREEILAQALSKKGAE